MPVLINCNRAFVYVSLSFGIFTIKYQAKRIADSVSLCNFMSKTFCNILFDLELVQKYLCCLAVKKPLLWQFQFQSNIMAPIGKYLCSLLLPDALPTVLGVWLWFVCVSVLLHCNRAGWQEIVVLCGSVSV